MAVGVDRQARTAPEAAPGLVATTRCPNCGTHRIGQFRYCRVCGLDFDVVDRLDPLRGVWPRAASGRPAVPVFDIPSGAASADSADSVDGSGFLVRLLAGRARVRARDVLVWAVGLGLLGAIGAALGEALLSN
jgi:hypothetical protein